MVVKHKSRTTRRTIYCTLFYCSLKGPLYELFITADGLFTKFYKTKTNKDLAFVINNSYNGPF